jgi:soluble lytic murein transglycosylase-like protein
MALANALVAEDDHNAAVVILIGAPDSIRQRADVELLDLGDETTAALAAFRLAREAPQRLRSHSSTLERSVLDTFEHEDWMARAAAWRAAGLGSRGAAELRKQRRHGEQETQRRIELARCELDAGSPSRALNALGVRRGSDPLELGLRAEAYRRRAWGRMPDRAAVNLFQSCLNEAQSVAVPTEGPTRIEALILILECGTEAGKLVPALDAWRQLETSGWEHRRRTWLGRRLGVALARSGADPQIIDGMASALPNHERCLHYWRSVSDPANEGLADLAEAKISDIYGRWARRHTGADSASTYSPASDPVGTMDPPFSVAWLLANAGSAEASDEWRRNIRRRRPGRSEALSAAVLAADAGRSNTAIRNLRAAFPTIGTVAIADIPADAARAYLPLRWADHILQAARETGVDPWLIAAVARQESTFNAHARSPANARGVLQLLPSTARLHARKLGLGSRPDLEDPAINIRLGAQELAWLIRRFGATEPALAAYNAGDRRVRRWWKRWPETESFTESIPIPETYNYVRRVVFLSDAYRQIHADAWRTTP